MGVVIPVRPHLRRLPHFGSSRRSQGGNAAAMAGGKLCDEDAVFIGNYPMTLCCWVRFTDKSTAQTVMAISDSGVSTIEFRLDITTSGHAQFTRENGATESSATNTTDLSDGNWHLLCGVGTSITSVSIQVDDQTPDSDTTSVAPTDFDRVCIGDAASVLFAQDYKGDADQAALFDIALTTAQKTWLYNSGSGRTYSELVSSGDADNPGTANLVGFWSLNEDAPAGIGDDDSGTKDLTVTGTVTTTDGVTADD